MAMFMAIMAVKKVDFGHFWGPKHIEKSPVSTNKWIKHVRETWSKAKSSTQHYCSTKLANCILMAIIAFEKADFGQFYLKTHWKVSRFQKYLK